MTVNATEYRTAIGLDSLYVAEVTTDDSGSYVAGTPAYLAPVAELSGAPQVSEEILYFDDTAYETLSSEGTTERKIVISGLPPEMEAWLTGEKLDAVTGRMYDSATPASAPYFALGYRSQKSNGHYRYYWFLKGKFQKPGNEHTTLGEKAEAKTVELTYTAMKTVYKFDQGTRTDGVKRVSGDEDTTNFVATGWFTAVQTPASSSASALTCVSVPADGATGIVVTADITLTFNNAIRTGNTGIMVTKADGTLVAATYSWGTTLKVLTINPDASLAGASDYLITLSGVTDIYGQVFANTVRNFTTA